MIKAIYGKDKILMFRLLENDTQEKATKLALQTEHTLSYENNVDTTQTKDGAVTSNGGTEVTLEINAIASHDDVNKMLEKSVIEHKELECWEVDLSEPTEDGKYPAKYMQGKLENWESPANVEELTEISTTMKIDGIPQDGYATVSKDQEKAILYAFRDTTIFEGEDNTTETEGH